MRILPILASLLAAACGQREGQPQNGSEAGPPPARGPVQTATLTGLYESTGSPPGQLCIIEEGRGAHFGLVIRRGEAPGCSGAGSATRSGTTLRLVMNGDSACAIEARLDGTRVTFPDSLPSGCAYYCAPGASAAGAAFTKTGGTNDDARRARDLVGDPLCG